MGRQRWLGFLAIGLGVLALFSALSHRGGERNVRVERHQAAVAVPVAPAAPASQAAPQPPAAFAHRGGPHGWGGPGMHRGGHGGPGFLLDGLLKLAMIFVLTALGLRLLRGGRGSWGRPWRMAGPPWRHGPQPWQEYTPPPAPRQSEPAPPDEPPTGPQTGQTTRL